MSLKIIVEIVKAINKVLNLKHTISTEVIWSETDVKKNWYIEFNKNCVSITV